MENLTTPIPFLNLRKLFTDHRVEFIEAMTAVLDKAAYIGGEQVNSFEQKFAEWVNPGSTVVGCANGTDAITLGAQALKLPAGSEAIVPAMTYIATAAGLMQAGLKVKLVDVSPKTWLMDPEKLEKAITPNTRLIAPVHLYGQMAPMDKIREIADKYKCVILEDAAQAHGATWKDKPVGHWGDVATYSFYPGKNLGAFGDGGAVLSKNKATMDYCRALAHQGGLKKYEHNYLGYNSRLDNLQASVLNIKMKYISKWNEARRSVAKAYGEMLSTVKGLTLPVESPGSRHVYHLYVVQVEKREAFMEHMKKCGVETGIHYPAAIHQLPAFAKEEFASQSFPNATETAAHGVSLPMCPTLNIDQIRYVAESVKKYFA